MKNILLVASKAQSLINFRGDFILDLHTNGYKVYTLAPETHSALLTQLKELNATHLDLKLNRKGLNPFTDVKTLWQIKKIIETYKIDLVFPYTIKPVIYSSFASKLAKHPSKCVSLITGLGLTFSRVSLKAKLLQIISQFLYKNALKTNNAVIFQNRDDEELFKKLKIVKKVPTYVVNGSGVNTTRFPLRTYPKIVEAPVKFVYVGRLIKSKGVNLILQAAESLVAQGTNLEIHVLGDFDGGSDGIDVALIEKLKASNVLIMHGHVKDVPSVLKKMDVFVLPTYYREGVPRSILEALSIGLPIITTDTPGCRETVVNGVNGFLIEPQKLDLLIEAMKHFIQHPANIKIMGLQSRSLAENKFEVTLINKDILRILAM